MYHVTLLLWYICITVAILSSLGQELDPVLHLGDTAIYTVAGALASVANHPHLGESKYVY